MAFGWVGLQGLWYVSMWSAHCQGLICCASHFLLPLCGACFGLAWAWESVGGIKKTVLTFKNQNPALWCSLCGLEKVIFSPHLIFPIFKMGLMKLFIISVSLGVGEVLLKRQKGPKHSYGSKVRMIMKWACKIHSDTSKEKPFQTAGPLAKTGVWSKA